MSDRMSIDLGKLWGGGAAAAAVAGAAGIVFYLVAEVLFEAQLMVPANPGSERLVELQMSSVFRAGFVSGLIATAVLWLLLVTVPSPTRFFGWLAGLGVVIAGLIPFSYPLETSDQAWLAVINVVMGITIISLLLGVVHRVVRYGALPGMAPPRA